MTHYFIMQPDIPASMLSNRFSLRRMALLLMFNRRSVAIQLAAIAAVEALLVLMMALMPDDFVSTLVKMLTVFVSAIILFSAPLPFSGDAKRVVVAMLPARPVEKFLTVVIYSVVIVPLFMIVVWSVFSLFAGIWVEVPSLVRLMTPVGELSEGTRWVVTYFVAVQYLTPVLVAIWVIQAARHGAALKGILAAFATQLVLWTAVVVVGVCAFAYVAKLYPGHIEELAESQPEQLLGAAGYSVDDFIFACFAIGTLVLAAIDIFLLYRSYRAIKGAQI